MKILTERLHVGVGVKLEVKTYYGDIDLKNPDYNPINDPCIIFGIGFGGSARESSSADNLVRGFVERGYKMRLFSPRNSGESTGHFTVENYVSDLEMVIGNSAHLDDRDPFVIGHSIGGYALGRILSEENQVEKAVLLAPLLDMTEQNPWLVDKLLKLENPIARSVTFHSLYFINSLLVRLGASDQRFSGVEDAYEFAESLYSSRVCESKMDVPTYVILPGWTSFGSEIKNRKLAELRLKWKKLQCDGSKIDALPDVDYYFSGSMIKALGGRNFFLGEETKEIVKNIDEFFKG